MKRDQYIKAAGIVQRIDEVSYVLKGIRSRDAIRINAGTHTLQLTAPCAISDDYYVDCHTAVVKALEDYHAALQQALEKL